MKLKFKIVEEYYDDYRLEKMLRKIAKIIDSEFDSHFGYSFQGYPLCMSVYDFDKDSFHEKEVVRLKIRNDKIHVYKRHAVGHYYKIKSFRKKSKLLSFIKKACNGR